QIGEQIGVGGESERRGEPCEARGWNGCGRGGEGGRENGRESGWENGREDGRRAIGRRAIGRAPQVQRPGGGPGAGVAQARRLMHGQRRR
ncbi:hypothetical protein, partial [Burkholderia glumae]|uniref:hypothetical protein n=1 Tax=Burkholderia glumae TaxID=337 RepID=UPI001E59E42C